MEKGAKEIELEGERRRKIKRAQKLMYANIDW